MVPHCGASYYCVEYRHQLGGWQLDVGGPADCKLTRETSKKFARNYEAATSFYACPSGENVRTPYGYQEVWTSRCDPSDQPIRFYE